ncbi:DNRLRE domain-containing protein [[Eubacterium] cellulosolvens]
MKRLKIVGCLFAIILAICTVMISQAAEASFIPITPPSADNEIENWQPDTNFGTQVGMYVRSGSTSFVARSIVQFDLSSIPAGSKINSAYLQMYYFSAPLGNPAGRTYNVYRLSEDWTELGSTWNSRDTGIPWTTPGGVWTTEDSTSSIVPPSVGQWMSWDVTGIVQDWIENGQPNNGFIIRDPNDGVAGVDAAARFSTKENTANWPVLKIDYELPGPVGGVSTPVNKLEILTPYMALAGLIAAISTVYVIRKRKD